MSNRVGLWDRELNHFDIAQVRNLCALAVQERYINGHITLESFHRDIKTILPQGDELREKLLSESEQLQPTKRGAQPGGIILKLMAIQLAEVLLSENPKASKKKVVQTIVDLFRAGDETGIVVHGFNTVNTWLKPWFKYRESKADPKFFSALLADAFTRKEN